MDIMYSLMRYEYLRITCGQLTNIYHKYTVLSRRTILATADKKADFGLFIS